MAEHQDLRILGGITPRWQHLNTRTMNK